MVREVGFEPTNPYGTGASGLRVQDPTSSTGLFDLAWQHEPPIIGRTPANTRPAPAKTTVQDKALIGFRQSDTPSKSGQCLIEPRPEPHPTRNPAYPNQTGNMSPWPPDAERHDAYEAVAATAGDAPDNTETAECKVDTATQDGNATDGAASSATAGRSEQQASCPSTRNTSEPST